MITFASLPLDFYRRRFRRKSDELENLINECITDIARIDHSLPQLPLLLDKVSEIIHLSKQIDEILVSLSKETK